jgi:hypothetical protein
MSKKPTRNWEDRRDVEAVVDYISAHFSNDKELPKRLEKATTPNDLQNEVLIFVMNREKELAELRRLARAIKMG